MVLGRTGTGEIQLLYLDRGEAEPFSFNFSFSYSETQTDLPSKLQSAYGHVMTPFS